MLRSVLTAIAAAAVLYAPLAAQTTASPGTGSPGSVGTTGTMTTPGTTGTQVNPAPPPPSRNAPGVRTEPPGRVSTADPAGAPAMVVPGDGHTPAMTPAPNTPPPHN